MEVNLSIVPAGVYQVLTLSIQRTTLVRKRLQEGYFGFQQAHKLVWSPQTRTPAVSTPDKPKLTVDMCNSGHKSCLLGLSSPSIRDVGYFIHQLWPFYSKIILFELYLFILLVLVEPGSDS